MKKITVIIPCYNGYKFMSNCLTSLENQTYKDFKVIVVDDCSTDNTYEELLKYQTITNLDLTVIRNEQNMRCALTRAEGVKKADTEWICFCDCDDWYEPDFLEKMFSKAEKTGSDMVMCHFNYVYPDGRKKFLTALNILSDESSKEEFIAFTPMSLCRFVFKRYLYDNLTTPPINNAEDGAVTPQILAKSKKISIVHEGLYNYYIRENSLSYTPSQSVYFDYLIAQRTVNDAIKDHYPDECEFIAIKNFCYGAMLNAFKANIELNVLKKDYNEFLTEYPEWHKNKYIFSLSKKRKIFLFFLKHKMFLGMKLFAILHKKISH